MLSVRCLKYSSVILGRQTANLEFRSEIKARRMDVGEIHKDSYYLAGLPEMKQSVF